MNIEIVLIDNVDVFLIFPLKFYILGKKGWERDEEAK